ncbi:hypothetical protein CROQUDRAFT_35684 [Cronartium quercuum f. sp. fusiforme G11]|uniref:Chord-domain-containing protein n=1 Tax=Cronartium quercuum f. sp. fusiforme G11 TaxID=708437 RepID=A0A9P6THZ6_9BASI|nr:hypothetical protein CROQUDRAFT_35684 [Cronartium quercuum f. sp. fusiforme G11]
MALIACTRPGCGKQFDPSNNNSANCVFHPGNPVFHEGMKSWSCCKETNKPVLEFDQFMKLKGCTSGTHSSEKPTTTTTALPSTTESATSLSAKSVDSNGVETYGKVSTTATPTRQTTSDVFKPIKSEEKPKPKLPQKELEDDENVLVPVGSKCKRLTCGQEWSGEPGGKRGKLVQDECTYHPGTPIFHEGSKGYSCCKRRVLDFDDFLKIVGCKNGSHLFVGPPKLDSEQEELVECRFDYYQTPTSVIVSVFGKGAVKEASGVVFEAQMMTVDLKLPANKRFTKSFKLFGPIDTVQSTYKILSSKCEIVLVKLDGVSWSNLEEGDKFAGTV